MAQTTARARPFYAPLAGGSDSDSDKSSSRGEESIPLTAPIATETARQQRPRPRPRRRRAARPPSGVGALLPTARRFWADFTLGFADGLTVPFALTAGLSSLGGRTDTVVYAGMAEVSAGCISMGIGGYLSARPAAVAAASPRPTAKQNEQHLRRDPEAAAAAAAAAETRQWLLTPSADTTAETIADRYLAPLGLPRELHRRAVAHVVAAGPQRVRALQMAYNEDDEDGVEEEEEEDDDDDNNKDEDEPVWPIAAGLSVALGYLVGGLLPLGPYVATASVGDGLRWSFAVCLVALFGFGFARDFFLAGASATAEAAADDDDDDDAAARREKARRRLLPWTRRRRVPWRRLRKSAGEGLQMVVLGGIAAVAAVLCVRLFEGGSGGGGGGGGGGAAEAAGADAAP